MARTKNRGYQQILPPTYTARLWKTEEEWVRVPNTHEAIIAHETFDKVQALLVRDTRTSPKGREAHLFSGFLKCADCGKSITRSQSGKISITPAPLTRTAPGRPAPCTLSSTTVWRPPFCSLSSIK